MTDLKLEVTGKQINVERSDELSATFEAGHHLLLWYENTALNKRKSV
jgi:hypothetical protein